jgi:uracil phosphoribosyltransferase
VSSVERVVVLDHPLVQHQLRLLRDRRTERPGFVRATHELSRFVAYEALRDAPLGDELIETPVSTSVPSKFISGEFLVVPVLRAGLGMLPALQELLPRISVALVGVRRDERTLAAEVYLDAIPDRIDDLDVVVCDPMLAAGGSLSSVVGLLVARGATTVSVLTLIASRPGVERLSASYPQVRIVTAALDETLNDDGYIVPGLGDAGDRLFGPAS